MTKRTGISLVVVSSLLALPWPALAEGKGLPQLDANLYPGQLFWLAICFPLVFILMRYLAVPSVKTGIDKRREVLRIDLEQAEADDNQAKALREEYEQALARARAQAQAMVNDMMQAAAKEETERRASQQEELAGRIASAEARIATFRDKALKEAREAAADLAEAIVEKLIGSKKTT